MNTNDADSIWQKEDDQRLINFVRNNAALHNAQCKAYEDGQVKQILWKNIGTVLKKSGTDCCKRWTILMNNYIQRKGKPDNGSEGEAAKKKYYRRSFSDSIPQSQKSSTTNVVEDEINETTKDFTEKDIKEYVNENITTANNKRVAESNPGDVFKQEKKKRKITHLKKRLKTCKEIVQGGPLVIQKEWDETDLYFSSMAMFVKKLPRYEQIQFRMKIMHMLGNAELKCLSNDSSRSANDHRPLDNDS